jgi:hypothetical protein
VAARGFWLSFSVVWAAHVSISPFAYFPVSVQFIIFFLSFLWRFVSFLFTASASLSRGRLSRFIYLGCKAVGEKALANLYCFFFFFFFLSNLFIVAQKTFLALRTIANRYANDLQCIAVSHSSQHATQKWLDMLGGAWNVQVVIDEDRAIYAAWGLGLGSVWYVLNPTTQVQSWKEKGWLGEKVAGAIQRTNTGASTRTSDYQTGGAGVINGEGPSSVMGNKWQTSGAWGVDQRGTVVWGGKALRADDVLDLDSAVKALGF